MKKDKFELVELIKTTINELFDFNNIEIYEYKYYGNGEIIGEFNIDDGSKVKVYKQIVNDDLIKIPPVIDKNNDIINIIYTIEDITSQYKITNLKELLKIIKTVVVIITKFVNSRKDNPIYTIYPESKTGLYLSDRQKREMYSMILSKHLPKNYRIVDSLYDNEIPIIMFQKIK